MLQGHPFLAARNVSQNVRQALSTAVRKGDGHGDGVNEPAKDHFECGPAGVAVAELGNRDGLTTGGRVLGIEGTEDIIDGMEDDAADAGEAGFFTACAGRGGPLTASAWHGDKPPPARPDGGGSSGCFDLKCEGVH